MEKYFEILENSKDEMLEKLSESIKINSVQTEPVKIVKGEGENAEEVALPFGKGVEDAYRHMTALGRELGFDVFDESHYGGHIEWKAEEVEDTDEAVETFGIAAHLDVVPVGPGWDLDPFSGEIVDGKMYGRGTGDDKGPLVAALYAMKALKEGGAVPKMNIRLVLGLDEETGMEGIYKYFEAAGVPDMGITPDADFPLINGEKGFLTFDLAQKLTRHNLKDGPILRKLTGGIVPNAVPDYAKAVIASDDEKYYEKIREKVSAYAAQTGYDITAKKAGSSLSIEAAGKAAHGAMPELGLNAVSVLMGFLGTLSFAGDEINEFIDFYNSKIGFDINGERIGCAFSDEASGKLSFNVGIADINEDIAQITVNIRFPVTNTSEDVYAGIEQAIDDTKVGLVKKQEEEPVYIDVDDPFAVKLMEAYRTETGDNENQPIVIGGGTYAKKFKRMLAFGPAFPGDPDVAHQANEYIDIEKLMTAARIYVRALYTICCE